MITCSFIFLLNLGFNQALDKDPEVILQEAINNITENQPPHFSHFPETESFDKEYDFIIVGCGASGSILANRLSEVTSWKVLCLEAGEEESAFSSIPLTAPNLSETPYNWGYKTTHQDGVCEGMKERRCFWARGKALGGSTVINYMIYTRGNPADYDKWATLGNTGWSYKDVLPYFKRFEKVDIQSLGDLADRGTDGELRITYSPYETELAKSFINSGKYLGIPILDYNGKRQIGINRLQSTTRMGRRMSGAQAFLVPIRGRENLSVVKNAFVTKVIINRRKKEAKGVEFLVNNATHRVFARKEVILSGGTMNSPQILMLSGIGPRKHLKDLGIRVIKNLPVGKNLQDHVAFFGVNFLVDKPISLLDIRIASDPHNVEDYLNRGRGPYTVPGGAEAIAFVNTNNVSGNGVSDIELLFSGALLADYGRAATREYGISDEIFDDVYSPIFGKDGFRVFAVVLKPKSVGYMKLHSKNPHKYPSFFPNYYKNQDDLRLMLKGIRLAIKSGLSEPMQRFNPVLWDKPFKPCAQHPFNSDEYWMCSAKLLSTSYLHHVGTCKMGPKDDKTAVVDPQLRVKGVKNLRVVDASIMPEITSGHTQAPSYMIGAKAADMIKEFHGY